jgi:aspartate aminotransferase
VPKPSWSNHRHVFSTAGFDVQDYSYLDTHNTRLDIDAMVKDLQDAPDSSTVLLHACAHNPTGIDPSASEWVRLASVLAAKNHLAFFDSAYQGYASGDVHADAYAVRLFARLQVPMIVAQSFAKNMGLYGERVGCLHVVCDSASEAQVVMQHLKQNVIRASYSSPVLHGARIAALVLGEADLRAEWAAELQSMADRVRSMRQALRSKLEDRQTPSPSNQQGWKHITDQVGMFAFTGIGPAVVACLQHEHHVYMTTDGRMNIAGLFQTNIDLVADAVHAAIVSTKQAQQQAKL